MAIEKNIVIGADLSGLEAKLSELIDALKDSQTQANKTSDSIEDIADSTKDIGKSAEESKKGVKSLSTGFKGMGVAIKAAGIGILLSAMGYLKELFDNNQKVVDVFSTSFNFLQIIFSEFSQVIESVYKNVSKSSENFDALGKVMSGIITVALTPMKLSFYAIQLAMEKAQLAWEQSFFGGKDPETIKVLQENIEATKTAIEEVATGALDAGKSIVSNIGEAISEVSDIGSQVITGLSEISVKSALDNAKAMTQLNKQAEIAESLAQGLIEKYDLQAEKLRQVRDDERLSIDERIKANEELLLVLEEQEAAMLANAQAALDKANQDLKLAPDNIEFIKARIDAENELVGVQAQVSGFRSEQLMNEMALQRELLDIERARGENETEIFEMQSEARRAAMLKERERINQEIMDIGTLAFRKKSALDEELENTQENTARYDEILNEKKLIDQEYQNNLADLKRQEKENERAVQESKLQMTGDALGAINDLAQAFLGDDEKNAEKAFKINKALGISQAVVSTAQAVMAQLAVPQDALTGANFVKAGIAAATGAAQIATIASQKFGDTSGGTDTNIPNPSASTSPSFNLVGQSGTNALLQSLQNNPVKAYVVGSDVTSQQQLDRNRINQVSFP